MNSVPALRAVVGVLVIALLGVSVLKLRTVCPADGNPIGFDVMGAPNNQGQAQPVTVTLQNSTNPNFSSCLTAANGCSAVMELHYLSYPSPTCPPNSSISPGNCAVPPVPSSTRSLPTCQSGQECLWIGAAPASDTNPYNEQMQDSGEQHDATPTNAQFVVILNSPSVATGTRKTTH
jgi:hypothetical protein